MKKTFIATVALSLGMVGIIATPTTTQASSATWYKETPEFL